jgi:hypothetical protein
MSILGIILSFLFGVIFIPVLQNVVANLISDRVKEYNTKVFSRIWEKRPTKDMERLANDIFSVFSKRRAEKLRIELEVTRLFYQDRDYKYSRVLEVVLVALSELARGIIRLFLLLVIVIAIMANPEFRKVADTFYALTPSSQVYVSFFFGVILSYFVAPFMFITGYTKGMVNILKNIRDFDSYSSNMERNIAKLLNKE